MVKHILALCLLACSCFGQAFTLMDPAFLGNVASEVRANPVMITNGLVAWWKMNEGTGTNLFDSWGTNTLTFRSPAPVWDTNGFPGVTNVYLHTNKAGAVAAQINTNFNLGTNDFSLTAWIRPTNSSWNRIVWATDQTRGGSFFALKSEAIPSIEYLCLDVPDSVDANAAIVVGPEKSSISANRWHFIAASRKGTNYVLSLDGTNFWYRGSTNQLVLSPVDYANPLAVIGDSTAVSANPVSFLGNIEEVTVRVGYGLTSNDMRYLFYDYYRGPPPEYVSPYPNITNNLMVYLKMNEGSGTTLINSTTNGINGWIQPPASWTDKGHNHKYAVNFGKGGYASTADLVGYNFVTNYQWSVGMWLQNTGSLGNKETLFYKNTSTGFPNIIPNPEVLRYTAGGGVNDVRYLSWVATPGWSAWNWSSFSSGWKFMVITRNFNDHTWYLCHDGIIETREADFNEYEDGQANPTGHAQYEIGNSPDPGGPWQGYIEEFRIHRNYCLSSNEVWYLYNRYYSP